MLLSAATDNDIRITGMCTCDDNIMPRCFTIVKSFLELVLILLRIDGVIVFLSEKLSQDSIKN